MSALWLWAFTDRSRPWLGRDAPEISRFSCILFLSVPWFSDYAGPAGHSRFIATGRVAFPVGNKVQRPNFGFSKLNRRPTGTPIYASASTSRCSLQDSGPRWIRCSFLVGLFRSQQHAGLSRRTSGNPVCGLHRVGGALNGALCCPKEAGCGQTDRVGFRRSGFAW
jgi:hypothetical protein